MENPDFSELPDVAWVNILSNLPFSDRYHVSTTCQRLNDAFNHPSLWDTVEVILSSEWENRTPQGIHFVSPDRHVQMIENFGSYIKNLTLVYYSYQYSIPDDVQRVLQSLKCMCRLESLTVDVDMVKAKQHLFAIGAGLESLDLSPLEELVATAPRLQNVTIRSWPIYEGLRSCDILGVLRNNDKSKNLQKLSLFHENAKNATWATLNILVPKPDEMLHTVSYFNNLSCLSLRSSMLSEDVVIELGKREHAPLEKLSILVTYVRYEPSKHIPDLSKEAWAKLLEHSPNLGVEFTIMTRMPYAHLFGLLKENIPVTAIGFMRYSKLGSVELETITKRFAGTLTSFKCYCDPENADYELLTLVSKCKELKQFVFHGDIYYKTVIALAEARMSDWNIFQVLEENISTKQQSPELGETDQDLVVAKDESGQVYLVQHSQREEQSEGVRQEMLHQMAAQVSACLGFSWWPNWSCQLEESVKETVRSPVGAQAQERQATAVPTKYNIAKGWPWI